jgi:hypothetical protein
MATLIIIPPKAIPHFDTLLCPKSGSYKKVLPENLKTITTLSLDHLKKEGIEPKRGDIIKFIEDVNTMIVHPEHYDNYFFRNKILILIFNGCIFENINFDYSLFGNIPQSYQFPEFPINHWNGIFDEPLIWFDYLPYRDTIIENLTVDIPNELIIEKNGNGEFYSWITLGLNVKIHLIIVNGRTTIDVVKKMFSDDKYCAIHQYENDIKDLSCILTYSRKYAGSRSQYIQSSDLLFLNILSDEPESDYDSEDDEKMILDN